MKKVLLLSIVCAALLGGCATEDTNAANNQSPTQTATQTVALAAENTADVEISEKMFIAQTNEIYNNLPDYIGKTIKYEGIFTSYDIGADEEIHTVLRYGPGCCGNDGNVGFEVAWPNDYPEENAWVEAVGSLEEFDTGDGYSAVRLQLTALTVLAERGQETVIQ